MDLYRFAEWLMAMDDAAWDRHAHPISVWTRIVFALPLLTLAIWSRVWIGWWTLVALAIVLFLIWFNPRMAPVPKRTDNWASKAVFGERVFLNRRNVPMPRHHLIAGHLLTAVSIAGLPFYIWGLAVLDPWITGFGAALAYLGKLWFCDRMVWLFEDMKDRHAPYREWLRP